MSLSIKQWGNSAAVRIPKSLLERASFHVGDKVDAVIENGTLVIKPARPSLDELLSKVTDQNRHTEVFSDKVGNELI